LNRAHLASQRVKIILPGFAERAPLSLKKLLEEDPSVMANLKAMHEQMMESGTLENVYETEILLLLLRCITFYKVFIPQLRQCAVLVEMELCESEVR
jgi:hypothetical protein